MLAAVLLLGLYTVFAGAQESAIGSRSQQHNIGSHWEIWTAASALGPLGALDDRP